MTRNIQNIRSMPVGMVVAMMLAATSVTVYAAKTAPVTVQMKTAQGQDAGTATLTQGRRGVEVKLALEDLPPGEHAIHVHEHALCDAPDFKSAGGHFNPAQKQHGIENPAGHHNGDMPINLTVAADGTDHQSFLSRDITLVPGAANSVFANGGTALMIHAKADDMKTDPTGNAGDRIACGLILPPPEASK